METTTSKITSKYQATIPAPVRKLLGLKGGDRVVFKIEGDKIILDKAQPMDLAFAAALEGTLSEWESDEDEIAYRDI